MAGCNETAPGDKYLCEKHLAWPEPAVAPSAEEAFEQLSVTLPRGSNDASLDEALAFFDDVVAWQDPSSVMSLSFRDTPSMLPRYLTVVRREGVGVALLLRTAETDWISQGKLSVVGSEDADLTDIEVRTDDSTIYYPRRFFTDPTRARNAIIAFAQGEEQPGRVLWHHLEPGEVACKPDSSEVRLVSLHLKAFSYEQLVERGVSQRFARILTDPNSYHPNLDILVGKTDWEYGVPDDAVDVVPLWDNNADSFVRWTRSGRQEFVLLYHDTPEWSVVALSEQGIMAELWRRWCDLEEGDDERFANALGFAHWPEAVRLWEAEAAPGQDLVGEWIAELGTPKPHLLPASLEGVEWTARFSGITEKFIAKFDRCLEGRNVVDCRSCDEDGLPIKWRFEMTDDEMLYHEDGSVSDAKSFLRNMIDQGMFVAFAICGSSKSTTVWVTCWETPDDRPVWPKSLAPVFERIHLGVRRAQDSTR